MITKRGTRHTTLNTVNVGLGYDSTISVSKYLRLLAEQRCNKVLVWSDLVGLVGLVGFSLGIYKTNYDNKIN